MPSAISINYLSEAMIESPFPPTELALAEPNGLLAQGGDLSPRTLLNAYALGIFPWFGANEPILWWTPDPRLVLDPAKVHRPRSLKKFLSRSAWKITRDAAFERVISACASPRADQNGTWIHQDMIEAYCALHQLRYAHSIEVVDASGDLVGGLYGVRIQGIFFGESMFSRASNASKVALLALCHWCLHDDINLIDCQMPSEHLVNLGAELVTRKDFENRLCQAINRETVNADQCAAPWVSTQEDCASANNAVWAKDLV